MIYIPQELSYCKPARICFTVIVIIEWVYQFKLSQMCKNDEGLVSITHISLANVVFPKLSMPYNRHQRIGNIPLLHSVQE